MSTQGGEAQLEDQSVAEVDRIRDIIFGSQMRGYDRRFKEVGAQLDLLNRQLEQLKVALDQQRGAQETRTNDLQGEMRQRLDQQRDDLSDRMQQQGSTLESQLRQLASDLSQQAKDLRSEFAAALNTLDDAKTDRHTLGDLLVEMGMRLKQQGQLADLLDQLEEAAED